MSHLRHVPRIHRLTSVLKRAFTLQVINMLELRPPLRIIVEECSFFYPRFRLFPVFKEKGDADLDGNLRGGDVFTEKNYLPGRGGSNVDGFSSSIIELFASAKRSLNDGFLIP